MKIRTKITLLVMTLMTAVVAAVAANALVLERRRVTEEAQARFDALLEGVLRIAKESLSSSDELMLLGYLKFLLQDYPEIEMVVVSRDGHSSVLGEVRGELLNRTLTVTAPSAATFQPVPSGATLSAGASPAPAPSAAPALPVAPTSAGTAGLRPSRPALPVAPTSAGTAGLRPASGSLTIQVGFSKAAIQKAVRDGQLALAQRIGLVAAVGLLVGLVGAWTLGQWLARPVGELAYASSKLAEGQLDAQVPVRGNDEFAELGRRFNAMAEKLRENLQFKEDLMSTLTHELNNPLAGLKGFLAYSRDAGPQERAEAYDTMDQAVQQMEISLKNALELFRSGAQPQLKRERLDLRRVADEVIRLFGPTARSRGLELRFRDAGPALVDADRELMRRVVINLVSNALKYTPSGGSIDVRLEATPEGTIHLAVADTGPGIPPEDREKIFTKFYRVPAAGGRARRIPGSGLGLAIAKHAVDLHAGRIWVDSVVGKQSVFHVSLPKSGGSHAAAIAK